MSIWCCYHHWQAQLGVGENTDACPILSEGHHNLHAIISDWTDPSFHTYRSWAQSQLHPINLCVSHVTLFTSGAFDMKAREWPRHLIIQGLEMKAETLESFSTWSGAGPDHSCPRCWLKVLKRHRAVGYSIMFRYCPVHLISHEPGEPFPFKIWATLGLSHKQKKTEVV